MIAVKGSIEMFAWIFCIFVANVFIWHVQLRLIPDFCDVWYQVFGMQDEHAEKIHLIRPGVSMT